PIIKEIKKRQIDQDANDLEPLFELENQLHTPVVPEDVLQPRNTWADKAAYDQEIENLVMLFQKNFSAFETKVNPEICEAGPR
ncbi:MAG: phosphoenolpyruvate carboxykinase (ATP), partial [Saprospiraceae bacterium]|nr:phosphoenolpyruvate carboxykinase (ATP) [Saprospiraceae bacterium]